MAGFGKFVFGAAFGVMASAIASAGGVAALALATDRTTTLSAPAPAAQSAEIQRRADTRAKKHLTLIARANDRLRDLEFEVEALNVSLSGKFDTYREFEVDSNKRAYALLPPKLMMSVETLRGGPVLTNVGNTRRVMPLGAREDLTFEGRDCFLVLMESRIRYARFLFGCEGAAL